MKLTEKQVGCLIMLGVSSGSIGFIVLIIYTLLRLCQITN
jgi:ABC-type cobalamin transport system permease subunit